MTLNGFISSKQAFLPVDIKCEFFKMATVSADSATGNLILCSICVEKYKTPRCLPCMHSFCHNCLSTYIASVCKSTEPRLGFKCPLCREYIPFTGANDKPEEWAKVFPVNVALQRLVEKPDERFCDACLRDNETENATGFCLSCAEYLCALCTKYHRKHLLSKGHTVCQVEEIRTGEITHEFGKYYRCSEHNESIKLFCGDHEQPCCLMCAGTCRSKHRKCENVDTVHNAAVYLRENDKLNVLLKEVRNIENKLTEAKQEQEKNMAELEDSFDEMTKKTEQEFKDLTEHIKKMKNKHLEDIAVAQKRGREKLDQCASTLEDGINCAKKCCQNIEKARKTMDERELLMNYYLAKDTASQLKQCSFRTKHIKVTENKASILKELKDMESLIDIDCTTTDHHVIYNLSTMQLPIVPKFRIEEESVVSIYTGTFLSNDTFAVIDHAFEGQCIIYDNAWAKTNVINGLYRPFCVVQNLDELFVTCTGTMSIKVYSATDFQKLRTIPMNESVYGIQIRNRALYVACATKIIKTDLSGNKTKEFETEGKNNIHLLLTNKGLIVYSNWVLDTVTAISEDGDIIWKYENENMKDPFELEEDSVNNVVVAAKKSNNIHVLSNVGEHLKVIENITQPVFIKMNERMNICCVCSNRNVLNVYRV
ncbi:E3 ubiquitin-protein ligase Midline-1-like [Saccostrea cucullata]|uniref:E3 ubiquitin-protein ligase Midline-1-like n=1 Tax=Saccostrea cuccullata TaxID=36930 RepID=UPI002ED03F88